MLYHMKEKLSSVVSCVPGFSYNKLGQIFQPCCTSDFKAAKYLYETVLLCKVSITLNALLFINRVSSFGGVTMTAKIQCAVGKWSYSLNR